MIFVPHLQESSDHSFGTVQRVLLFQDTCHYVIDCNSLYLQMLSVGVYITG